MNPSSDFAVNALATQLTSTMHRAIRDQRAYVETLSEQTIRDGHVHGFIDLPGDGEVVVDVTFPISFMERPVFTAGLELGKNISFTAGNFPIYSATVGRWTTRSPAGAMLYTGATLGIVVVGPARSVLHYKFEGRTFTVPTGTESSLSAPL
jgi:hypothetical protein